MALAVVGESGAGKSTLLELCLGLQTPSEGEVRLCGGPWSALREAERKPLRPRIQAVFQEAHASLPPHRTGFEILEEPLEVRGRGDRAQWRERALRLASRVGFPEGALGQRPSAWSGGMAQRLALARALMAGPDVLVLDEPLSALDPPSAERLLVLLGALKAQGLAILLASHDLSAVARLSEDLLLLYGGETMDQGPTAELLATRHHPYLRALCEAVPEPRRLPARWGQASLRQTVVGGCVLLDRCPEATTRCERAPDFAGALRCHHPLD